MDNRNLITSKYGWYASALGRYRPSKSTYSLYSYENLPPITETQLDGTFQWLTPLDKDIDKQIHRYYPREETRENLRREGTRKDLQKVVDQAQVLGLTLPKAFIQLMSSLELIDRIPSCTACYFSSNDIFRYPGSKEGYIINFLVDQQGILCWYLYITPDDDHYVLVSPLWLEELEETNDVIEKVYICSLSFEAFIYRFWLENIIWFNLNNQKPLTEEQKLYLEHYMHSKEKM